MTNLELATNFAKFLAPARNCLNNYLVLSLGDELTSEERGDALQAALTLENEALRAALSFPKKASAKSEEWYMICNELKFAEADKIKPLVYRGAEILNEIRSILLK